MTTLTLYLYDQDLAFSMNISSMSVAVLFLMCRIGIIVWLSHSHIPFLVTKYFFRIRVFENHLYVYITFYKVSREILLSHYPGIQER